MPRLSPCNRPGMLAYSSTTGSSIQRSGLSLPRALDHRPEPPGKGTSSKGVSMTPTALAYADRAKTGSQSEATASATLFTALLWLQGLYYLVTGVWPLVSIETFQTVTGWKTDHLVTGRESDHWLVMTVGV